MRLTKLSSTFAATVAASSLIIVAGPPTAQATPSDTSGAQKAVALAKKLGSTHTAGVYLDSKTGAPVLNVTSHRAARMAKTAGLSSRRVKHSSKQLAAAKRAVDRNGLVPGTAWAVDPKADRLTVTLDPTVTKTERHRITSVTQKLGDRVSVHHTDDKFRQKATGGSTIWGQDARCSLGFNVVYKKHPAKHGFLTAGHCGNTTKSWSADKAGTNRIGRTAHSTFPGSDYAIVNYTKGTGHPSKVGKRRITKAGTPQVGTYVARNGGVSGIHKGHVKARNATVHFQEGTVSGLIKTNICSDSGDSGGALYRGHTAYGLTSGGSGNCSTKGTTFFQPVKPALETYGAKIG